MRKQKVCKNCGSLNLVKGRRICKKCNSKRVSDYYHRVGKKRREENLTLECPLCGNKYIRWIKSQAICPKCSRQSRNTGFVNNQYKMISNKCEHRVIAEQVIGRKLAFNEVVHHVDENIHNNELSNLWVMSRSHHGRLHKFLRLQRVIYEKSLSKDSTNYWDKLKINQTETWLKTNNVEVIKLIELNN